jgi:hypothetical protein
MAFSGPDIVVQMTISQPQNEFPFTAMLVGSAAVVTCLYLVVLTGDADLSLYFGNVSPVLAVALVCATGILALYALHRNSGFSVYDPYCFRKGIRVAVALVLPFMIIMTFVDVAFRFPPDINVALPTAMLFYPAIGYVAQIALHVAPFAILLSLTKLLFKTRSTTWCVWLSITIASAFEATFQAVSSLDGDGLSTIAGIVAVILWLFGVAELYLYRRFDFATMYAFRIFYYCYWHLLWGNLRIHWLY